MEQKEQTIGPAYVRLDIEQAANGFIVAENDIYGDRARRGSNAHVFQTFAELTAYLGQRFTHRQEVVHGDRPAQ